MPERSNALMRGPVDIEFRRRQVYDHFSLEAGNRIHLANRKKLSILFRDEVGYPYPGCRPQPSGSGFRRLIGTWALLVLVAFLFELAEAMINRIQTPDDFLIISAVLVLDLNQGRKGNAAL